MDGGNRERQGNGMVRNMDGGNREGPGKGRNDELLWGECLFVVQCKKVQQKQKNKKTLVHLTFS